MGDRSYRLTLTTTADGTVMNGLWAATATAERKFLPWIGSYSIMPGARIALAEQGAGDLQADEADAGGGAGDQHRLAGAEGAGHEGAVFGEQSGGQRTGLRIPSPSGMGGQGVPMVGRHVLGETGGVVPITRCPTVMVSTPSPTAVTSPANS